MLLEQKTLYDTRVHSRNIPQCRKIHLCATREIEKKNFAPGEKSCTVINHLAQELIPYKVASSTRLKRTSNYIKGMLIIVNVLML